MGVKNQIIINGGSENKSLNQATRYSLLSFLMDFLTRASLVAREKALTKANTTHRSLMPYKSLRLYKNRLTREKRSYRIMS